LIKKVFFRRMANPNQSLENDKAFL